MSTPFQGANCMPSAKEGPILSRLSGLVLLCAYSVSEGGWPAPFSSPSESDREGEV